MADVSFIAFVEDVKDWMMKTSEPHRVQVDGQWKTVSRTYRTVKAAYGVTIDFSQFVPGERIKVVGRESTTVREYDGKKFYDLICKAESVERVMANEFPARTDADVSQVIADAFPTDSDAPF